ncbi:carbonic anhydrase [Powellomyces hirtus]|uniref:Carbonic anhydrase n=1 Tax=Powellomyces hirtus TaxID=109895 RepID=A0A507DYA6_9FUNG|nr:carbonic anhydrase [Powellomyces hirtus]
MTTSVDNDKVDDNARDVLTVDASVEDEAGDVDGITPEKMLQNNKEWAAEISAARPGFFEGLAKLQAPDVLWIGCSDSRVPANQLLKLDPGEVFVHRNVAAIVHNTDLNSHVVLQYAVDVLKVKHVIVCGHYGCGGVAAALTNRQFGLIDYWIRVVKDLYKQNEKELSTLSDAEKCDRMVELNVENSVKNVAHSTVVQNAWARGQELAIYGWCYRLTDGILKDLKIKIDNMDGVTGVHRVGTPP